MTTIDEDTTYTFSAADFGFTDPVEGNAFLSVIITTLPPGGTLTLSGNPVIAGQEIPVGQLGNLVFTPPPNASGTGRGMFTFQVRDNGGTANGGVDTDQSPNTFYLSVAAVNDAPVNSVPGPQNVNEDGSLVLSAAFGNRIQIADVDPGSGTYTVTLSVAHGILTVAVVANVSYVDNGTASVSISGTVADINNALTTALFYNPDPDYNGPDTIQIVTSDNGNVGSGGTLTDTDTVAITVASVNDAPAGTDNTVTINEDATYTFATADFGFSDPDDSPANSLLAVTFTTVPANGTLFYDADGAGGNAPVAVTAGQSILAAEIALGKVTFVPAPDANGTALASFTFQVQDNGGTANGGVDTDQSANIFTFDVTAVNDAPVVTITPPSGVPLGSETRINTTEAGYQYDPSVEALAGGGYVVTWFSNGPGEVFVQRYNAAGLPQGGETQVNTTTANIQDSAKVSALNDGGYVVVWESANQDGGGFGIYAQRYDATGVPQGTETLVNTTTTNEQRYPSVAGLNGGGYVVAWMSFNQDGNQWGVYAQRYDASGVPQGGETLVNTTTAGTQREPAVAALDGGGYVIVWYGNGPGDTAGIFAQRYTASGVPQGGETLVNTTTTDAQVVPVVAGLAGGGYVVVWMSHNGVHYDIYAQRFDASGVAQGGETLVNTTTADQQLEPSVAALADGGYVVTWQSNGQDGSGNGIYAQRYDAAGVPQGGEFLVNSTTAMEQVASAVAGLNGGGYVVTWQSFQDSDGFGIYAQRFGAGSGFVATEQVGLDLKGTITVADIDAGSADVTVTLSVDYGILTVDPGASGVIVANSGTASVTLTGALAEINNLLGANAVGAVTFTANTDDPPASAELSVTIDDGGNTGTGGALTDSATATINIAAVNDAPSGADNTVTINEDSSHTFAAADFGFSDPGEGDGLLSVVITTLPGAGTLTLSGNPVVAGQEIPAGQIGNLVFTPAANANGNGYASFTFQVRDNGGTANGGVDTDQSANSFTFNVTAVNDVPAFTGLDGTPTYTENGAAVVLDSNATVFDVELAASGNYAGATLTVARNGGASSQDTYTFSGGTIAYIGSSTLGSLTSNLGGLHSIGNASRNGGTFAVTFNANATQADVNAVLQQLAYANSSENPPGTVVLNYTFTDGNGGAQGSGGLGTATGSVTVTVVPVNDAPAGTNNTVTGSEDDPLPFTAADFGFSDLVEGDGFAGVVLTTLPVEGDLRLNGVNITVAGTFVSAADIASGLLSFLADPDEFGDAYATFTFQVRDNGGTANGGQDTDQSANTMTINITPDNLPPVVDLDGGAAGVDYTTTFTEDGPGLAIGSAISVVEPDEGLGDRIESARVTLTDAAAGDQLFFNPALPAGFSAVVTATATSVTIDITGTGTGAQYQAILASLHYLSTSQDPTASGTDLTRTITVTVNDGTVDSAVATTTINIVAVDDPAVGQADAFTINENGSITAGNLFADNGSGADTDPDGPPLAISAVNGSGANVGTQITLASGALLTVNANGTFDYDPGTVFLPTPTLGSGASNTPGQDSFTYTLAGGNTVTVTISLTGLDTDDTLLGTGGNDVLMGGTGNDIYVVGDAGDQVIEGAGQGNDVVYALVSYQLTPGQEIERLSAIDWSQTTALNLTGNSIANLIEGNAAANVLNGAAGADTLVGFGGDDIYVVDDAGDMVIEAAGQGNDVIYALADYMLGEGTSVERLSAIDWSQTNALNLTGNSVANLIEGNAGVNVLNGAGGADTLVGFGGNDIYVVDDAGDMVIEAAGQGNDVVYALVSYQLTPGQEIERLSTIDWSQTTALNLTGNGIANLIEGNAGSNILDGGAGADVLVGFGGDDTYHVDNAGDSTYEAVGGGNDSVYASVSYTLTAGQEIELLFASNFASTSAINLTGNEFANTIYANAGSNVLDGKGGNDALVGLEGADTYQFTTALGAGNVDIIFGFEHGVDRIALDDAIFTAVGPLGALGANAFVVGSAAADADDRIIYNSLTGQLFYDADGNGAGAAVQFATIAPGLALTASDFTVI